MPDEWVGPRAPEAGRWRPGSSLERRDTAPSLACGAARATDVSAETTGSRTYDLLSHAPASARRAERKSRIVGLTSQVGSALSADEMRPAAHAHANKRVQRRQSTTAAAPLLAAFSRLACRGHAPSLATQTKVMRMRRKVRMLLICSRGQDNSEPNEPGRIW